jgi:hypothetical protein
VEITHIESYVDRPKFFPHIVDNPREVRKGTFGVDLKANILE